MRNRVERLRIWLLGGAGFLVLVIAAFLGSAHYLRHHLRAYLPEKLAANVKVNSTGVSWCDTVGSRTVYCIHAAKELEHADEKYVLHDVSIALYGEKQDRNDRIYGDEFEYRQEGWRGARNRACSYRSRGCGCRRLILPRPALRYSM